MIKLSHEWSADRYGDRVQFLDLASPRILEKLSGLVVHIPERILKKASELKETRPEGTIYPYIRAVGSSEIYSCNRNGDWWFDDDLRTKYGLFEKEAHLFRHHQNDDPAKAIGKILVADYNPATHIVDLLCETPAKNVEAELNRLRNGEKVATSIGAKVPWEQCSICRQKASSLEKRCSDLKNNIGNILPDGRLVCAFNPNPKFFDISLVTIGAGEESEWLCEEPYEIRGKSAGVKVISSAELASWQGLTDEVVDRRFFSKTASTKSTKTSAIEKQIPGSIVGVLGKDTTEAGSQLANEAPKLGPADLVHMKGRPFPEVLSSLSAMGILLRPEEHAAVYLATRGKMTSAKKVLKTQLLRPTESQVQKHGTINRTVLNPAFIRLDLIKKLAYLLPERSAFSPFLETRKNTTTVLTKVSHFSASGTTTQAYLDYRKTFPVDFFMQPSFMEVLSNEPKLATLLFDINPFYGYEKLAFEGNVLKHFLAPVGLSYLGAGYLVHRSAKKGEPVQGLGRTLVEHPLSVGGALGSALLAKKLLKRASHDSEKEGKKPRKPIITQQGFRNAIKGGIIFPAMMSGTSGKLALDIGGQAIDYLALKQLGRAANKLALSKKTKTQQEKR